jgi:hypothetical protein
MRFAAAAIISVISAALLSNVSAQEPICRVISAQGASFLEECGSRLNSFSLSLSETKLTLSEIKREVGSDLHGRFYFPCSVKPMCENEPTISGFFIAPESWNKSPKDEVAIYQASQRVPLMAVSWSKRGGPPPDMPAATCPLFDVSVDGMAGRAACFASSVVVVAADDHAGFLLIFYQHDKSGNVLRDKVLDLIPRFKIERAAGDAGLKRWMQ